MWQLLSKNIGRHVKLTPQESEKVASYFSERRFKKRQFIHQEGNVSRQESFILKGCTRTYEIDKDGQEHILQFGIEEWWIGDLYSFLSGKPSKYNIECVEDCEVLQITPEKQEAMFAAVPRMERFFRILVQNAYMAAQARILNSLSMSGRERYIEFIAKYPHIEQRIPNHQIASYLGLAPQSLSRIRNLNKRN